MSLEPQKLDYADPVERRILRLERQLWAWRMLAWVHLATAIVLLAVIGYIVIPRYVIR